MTKEMRPFALLFAGIIVMACGSSGTPIAQTSPAVSPTPSSQPSPSPTPLPAPTGGSAKVSCSGGPGTALAIVAGQFLYDVSNATRPRLVCRTTTTYLHLLDDKAIAYTTVAAKMVYVVRRDLTTGAESQIGRLPADPQGSKSWTSDGSLEVYSTSAPRPNGRFLVSVHLWSNGADHVLYTIDAGVGGVEGRWSALPTLDFSPDHAYVAVSDSTFTVTAHAVRIFSVADRRQVFVNAEPALGGTWIASDHFFWAIASGSVMHWTPAEGAKAFRLERFWHGPTSSSDGGWLAGTLLTNLAKPRVLIVPVGGGRTFQTKGLGSAPAFVTPSVVWYAEESAVAGGGATATWPDGKVHALDVTDGSDRVVQFRTGEKPTGTLCCTTRV
jgi:hypothetical protein